LRIERIEVFPLTSERFKHTTLKVGHPVEDPWCGYDQTLVRVHTDEGIAGWGGAGCRWEMVEAVRKVLLPHLIGQEVQPEQVTEKLHQWTFWYGRGGAMTAYIGAINTALWDIFGKKTGLSVSRLWGGRHVETVKPYASMLFSWPVDRMVHNLEAGKEKGFRAFKVGWNPFGRMSRQIDEEMVGTARRVIGDDAELMVDAGARCIEWKRDLKWAIETAHMLAEYDVTWFEEALLPDDLEGHKQLREVSPVRIATGEVLKRRQSFEPWIRERAADILQPDVAICGGMSEARRIWQAAYDRNMQVIMHGWNTAVGTAADLQLSASMPNGRYLEYWEPGPYVSEILTAPFVVDDDGMLVIPDEPGLGIEIDMDALKEKGAGHEDYGQ